MVAGRRPPRRTSRDEFANLPSMSSGMAAANGGSGGGRSAVAIPIIRPEGSDFDPFMPQGAVDGLSEVGVTGLRRNAGIVDEELLLELRGERGRRQVRMMIDEDPIIGAFLFAIEMLCRQVDWDVEPASSSNEDMVVADFVKSCLMDDMSHTWQDTLAEIVSFLPWGWSMLEIVWKRRNGEHPEDGTQDSIYNDGRIGIRKLSIRAQETLNNWIFDDNGGVRAMIQIAAPHYQMVEIPIEKALLFRTTSRKGNPEGRSILRNAYRPWYFKRNIERIEAIGVERDLAGFPMAWIPPAYLSPNATPEQKAMTAAMKQMVTNVRRDEQEGAVFPLAYDPKGNKLFDFSLLSSGGARVFDTSGIIQRYDQRIAASVLADFILLGSQSVGSFALASSKTTLFSVAIGTFLDTICDVVNNYLIKRLMRLNGWTSLKAPKLTHGDIESTDPKDLAAYVTALSGAGMPLFPSPNGDLEKYLLDVVGLPVSEDMAEGTEAQPGQPGQIPGGDGTAPPPMPPGASAVADAATAQAATSGATANPNVQVIDTTKMAEQVASEALELIRKDRSPAEDQKLDDLVTALYAMEAAVTASTAGSQTQLSELAQAVLEVAGRSVNVKIDAPQIGVPQPAPVVTELAVTAAEPVLVPKRTRKTVARDAEGRIESVTEEVLEFGSASITMSEDGEQVSSARKRQLVSRDAAGRIESIIEEVE